MAPPTIRPWKFPQEQPFYSLLVETRAPDEDHAFRRRLTSILFELVVGLGLLILVGFFSIAIWSLVASISASAA